MDTEYAGVNGYANPSFNATVPIDPTSDFRVPPGRSTEFAHPDFAPLLAQAAQSLQALSAEFPQAAPPTRGPGRWLRMLTGVDEQLLSRVWEERSRYTGLGTIVLGTALMATFSMFDALDQALGPVWPVLIIGALFWGTFICSIDRWLISSTHGANRARWRIFLPRIVMAVLFGIIIATPLVLTVFGSAVLSQAKDDQQNAVTAYDARLTACNPLPDPTTGALATPPAGCGKLTLSIPDPAIGLTRTIAQEKKQRDLLAQTVKADNQKIAAYDKTIRDECNGVSGKGLSGIPGVGPNCKRDRSQENTFERNNDVGKLQSELNALNTKIAAQVGTVGTQTQSYSDAITTAISAKVKAKQADEGRVGLLDRIHALGELMARSAVIAAATVLLGLFVLMVDCLPVLSKIMLGTTKYDRLVDGRLRTADKVAEAAMSVSERQATGRDEIALHSVNSEVRARIEEIDEASRVSKARRDAELSRQIADLAAEYRRSDS